MIAEFADLLQGGVALGAAGGDVAAGCWVGPDRRCRWEVLLEGVVQGCR